MNPDSRHLQDGPRRRPFRRRSCRFWQKRRPDSFSALPLEQNNQALWMPVVMPPSQQWHSPSPCLSCRTPAFRFGKSCLKFLHERGERNVQGLANRANFNEIESSFTRFVFAYETLWHSQSLGQLDLSECLFNAEIPQEVSKNRMFGSEYGLWHLPMVHPVLG